jgi:hypothetical protein
MGVSLAFFVLSYFFFYRSDTPHRLKDLRDLMNTKNVTPEAKTPRTRSRTEHLKSYGFQLGNPGGPTDHLRPHRFRPGNPGGPGRPKKEKTMSNVSCDFQDSDTSRLC